MSGLTKKIWLDSLIKSCKLVNDVLTPRLPIQFKLLELLLFELRCVMSCQPYLETLYTAVFAIAYYSLMRIGEVSNSPHNVKAANVHMAVNKDKIMIILYTSKTHTRAVQPQEIKIS